MSEPPWIGRLRQPGVAEDELHPLDRQAERLGRHLRHRRPGARPHVAGGTRHLGGAVGQETRPGRGGRVVHRVGGGRHAPADQPAAVAHRARLGVAPAPAEALGGGPVAFPRRAARERQLLELVLLRLVAQAQLDGVDVQRHRELVHGGFEREDAARLAGGAHVGRRVHVHGCQAMARGDVRARVQEPARVQERLRELLVGGGLLVALVHDGGEAAVARGAEGDALDRVRAVADAVVHLAPRQHQLDRPPRHAGAERRQRHVRPGAQPGAEGAADEGRDDADVLGRDAEHGGELVGHVVHPLRLVPQGQAVAVPGRDRGVHLDRVVVLARDHVGLVDLDLGGREGSFGIAAPRLVRLDLALVGLLVRRVHRLGAADVGGRGLGRVGDAHQPRRVGGLLEGLGDHERDRLALMVHPVVLEHVQALTDGWVREALVRSVGEPRRVAVGQDREHAGRPFGLRRVDRSDAAARDGAPHDGGMRHVRQRRTRRRRSRRR